MEHRGEARKKILFVDDDQVVLEATSIILRARYDVTPCRSGHEALLHFRNDRFDLVLADVLMPNMTGFELFHEIKRIRPEQRFVFITVPDLFDEDIEKQRIIHKLADGCVSKPYRQVELFDVLARAVEA